jgi:hypothetical protein
VPGRYDKLPALASDLVKLRINITIQHLASDLVPDPWP